MEHHSLVLLKNQVLKSFMSLGVRQIVVQGLNVLGGILLARLLSPQEFGLYAVATFLITFMAAFCDVGLGVGLIRQFQEPSEEDYQRIFSIQQLLTVVVFFTLYMGSPLLVSFYHLSQDYVWVFRLLFVSLLFTPFQLIPTIRLERNLAFDKIAVIEICQSVIYNATAVFLAWKGFGVYSFVLAMIARALAGGVLGNVLSPWTIRWRWDWEVLRPHMRVGIPYQGAVIINLVKDMINPVFVGYVAGSTAVGYINWATMVANYPVLFVMLFNRLYLPLFSKVAHDQQLFREALKEVITSVTIVVFVSSFMLYSFREDVVSFVFGSKWFPALVLFLPFTIINGLLSPTIIMSNALVAIGRTHIVFWLNFSWAFLTWVLGPTLIHWFGWSAWGWANLGVNLANLFVWWKINKEIGFNAVPSIVKAVTIAMVGTAISLFCKIFSIHWIIAVLTGLVVTGAVAWQSHFKDLIRVFVRK